MLEKAAAQVTPTFDDIAVYFSEEEWELLDDHQKELYVTIMKENYDTLLELGLIFVKPEIMLTIQKWEKTSIWDPPRTRRWKWAEGWPNSTSSDLQDLRVRVKIEDTTNQSPRNQTDLMVRVKIEQVEIPLCRDPQNFKALTETEKREDTTFSHSFDPMSQVKIEEDDGSYASHSKELVFRVNGEDADTTFPKNLEYSVVQVKIEEGEEPSSRGLCDSLIQVKNEETNTDLNLDSQHSVGVRVASHLEGRRFANEYNLRSQDKRNVKLKLLETRTAKSKEMSQLLLKLEKTAENNKRADRKLRAAEDGTHRYSFRPRSAHAGARPDAPGESRHSVPCPQGGKRVYTCAECKDAFNRKPCLAAQPRVHQRQAPHRCHECGMQFLQESDLHIHQKEPSSQPCPGAASEQHLSNFPSLASHKKTQAIFTVHACSACGKNFIQSSNLAAHQDMPMEPRTCAISVTEKDLTSPAEITVQLPKDTEEKTYSCKTCGKTFRKEFNFTKHQQLHRRRKLHMCAQYGKRVAVLSSLHESQQLPVIKKIYTGKEYGESFDRSCPLTAHTLTHPEDQHLETAVAGGDLHVCNKCGKSFSGLLSLTAHSRIHFPPKKYSLAHFGTSCPKGSYLTRYQRTLVSEMKKTDVNILTSANKPHGCAACGRHFIHASSLSRHRTRSGCKKKVIGTKFRKSRFTHSPNPNIHRPQETKVYECTECGKCLSSPSSLYCHKQIHVREKLYVCPECGKGFSNSQLLTTHKLTHVGQNPYLCHECGKQFGDISSFLTHHKTHTKQKPYTRFEYGKKCNQKSNENARVGTESINNVHLCSSLSRPPTVDLGHKSFPCDKCGKFFFCQSRLKQHHKIHVREHLFICSECGKTLSTPSSLRTHQQIHVRERMYACSECGKGFTNSQLLRTHKLTHAGENPYLCSECGQSFSDPSSFIAHHRTHKARKTYTCTECGKKYTHKSYFLMHKLVHSNSP